MGPEGTPPRPYRALSVEVVTAGLMGRACSSRRRATARLVCGASDGGKNKTNIVAGIGIREACRGSETEVSLGGMRRARRDLGLL